jgi:hypothetical protein
MHIVRFDLPRKVLAATHVECMRACNVPLTMPDTITPMSRISSFLNRYTRFLIAMLICGCLASTVYYGPAQETYNSDEERVSVAQLTHCAKAYAAAAITYCGIAE